MLRRVARLAFALALLVPALAWGGLPAFAAQGQGGAVYVLTNTTAGNAVAVFARAADGTLSPAGSYATGGVGNGGGLGSQGAVILSQDRRWLFAVNAGSNDISSFAVQPDGSLSLRSRVSSGGQMPISLTAREDLVYVLNGGGSGNISGFRVGKSGSLQPLSGSTRSLSNGGAGAAPGPAQVQFNPAGDVLVVTEKNTNLIDTYAVGDGGRPGSIRTFPSNGATPFGFAFDASGRLIVSEAEGGAAGQASVSSYRVVDGGRLHTISAAVPDTQTAACWLVISANGAYAFTTNAGSGTISAYSIASNGSLSLAKAIAGTVGSGTHPSDMGLSRDSKFVYTLDNDITSISAFRVQEDGSLTPLAGASGLPASAVGLAAW